MRQRGQGVDVVGVEPQGLLEQGAGADRLLRPKAEVHHRLAAEIEVHGVRRGGAGGAAGLGGDELDVEGAGEAGDDLVLGLEDVGDRLVEALRPQMGAAFDVDQLDGHPQAIPGALDRTLQGVAHVERLADLAGVDGAPLVGEGRVAGDHEASVDAGEVRRQALGHPIDEILLVWVAREVGRRAGPRSRAPGRSVPPGRPAIAPVVGLVLGDASTWHGGCAPAHEFLQTGQDLAPFLMVVLAVPVGQPGALDLVERQGRQDVVKGDLDQLVCAARKVGLGADPLRTRGGARPQHHHCLGVAEPLLDHLGIGAVRRKLVVPPDREPRRAHGDRDPLGLGLGFAGVRDEDVGHRHSLG